MLIDTETPENNLAISSDDNSSDMEFFESNSNSPNEQSLLQLPNSQPPQHHQFADLDHYKHQNIASKDFPEDLCVKIPPKPPLRKRKHLYSHKQSKHSFISEYGTHILFIFFVILALIYLQ